MIYLGIDCGTQSLKVLAWSPDQGVVGTASRAYDLIPGLPPGHKEQHPADWLRVLDECMLELKAAISMNGVRAVGVSGQQHGLVLLDGQDEVIRPAKLWNDTSTEPQCRRIMDAMGGSQAYWNEIGNLLPPGFTASKVLWVKENEPQNYRRVASLLLPHDYLNFHLTGRKTAEYGDASGTGYFRVRERCWSEKVLAAIDPERDLGTCVPPLVRSEEVVGTIRHALAERWGLPSGVKVSTGGGDNMMGAIGSGNVEPGLMTVSLGTSGTIYGYSAAPVVDPEGEIAAFCDSTGGWLPLGCTMNVTVATEMIRKGFFQAGHEEVDAAIRTVPPGADGLFLIPYLEGERMPAVPAGTGVLVGLRPATADPAHLARAAMEGVTLGLRYGLDRFQSLGLRPAELRLIGGGANSPVWRQMTADIFGLPVVCPASQEGPALGAALQAMWADQGGSVREIVRRHLELDASSRREPNDDAVRRYQELYELYLETSRTLSAGEVFPRHRRFIAGG
jgi:xylulokinase